MNFDQLNNENRAQSTEENPDFVVIEKFLSITNEQELLRKCSESIKKRKNIVGFGKNAEVFAIEDERNVASLCIKKIKKFPEIRYNDIYTEAQRQKESLKIGVKTPRYVMALKDHKDNQQYIIMEYIKGISLEEALEEALEAEVSKRKKIPEAYQHDIFFSQLDDMINLLHKNNIHHRDLHLGNIMIDDQGCPVIIDFGIAERFWGIDEEDLKSIYSAQARVLVDAKKGIYEMKNLVLPKDKEQVSYIKEKMKLLK